MTGGLCLSMIVRNETTIIESALAAAAPHISCYAIHDTGSSDGTPQLVEAFMSAHGIPGRVTHGVFVDFSQARNESLAQARQVAAVHDAGWLLLQDADMELGGTLDGIDEWHPAVAAFTLTQRAGDLAYHNVRLLRPDQPATYLGTTHEYLDLHGEPVAHLAGVSFIDHATGSSRAVKFERDRVLLEKALEQDPDDPRTVFYYAQTLRDLDRPREAYAAYTHRVSLAGWDQERWYALWQAARCAEAVGSSSVDDYLTAHNADPSRAEPLVDAARLEREHGRWHTAYLYARTATLIPAPGPDALFVDEATYQWRALDELAVAAWYAGHHDEGRTAAERALAARPDDERLRANLAYYA